MKDEEYNAMAEALADFMNGVREKTGQEIMIMWGAADGDIHIGGGMTTEGMDWSTAAKLIVTSVGELHNFYGDGGHEEDNWRY